MNWHTIGILAKLGTVAMRVVIVGMVGVVFAAEPLRSVAMVATVLAAGAGFVTDLEDRL